eukprot:SAG31_NODE_727_length_12536_cov_2.306022_4_plen_636_part_00
MKYEQPGPRFCTVDLHDGTSMDVLCRTAFSEPTNGKPSKTLAWSSNVKKAFKYELLKLPEYFTVSMREGAGRSEQEVSAGDFEFDSVKDAHRAFARDAWVGLLDTNGKFAGRLRVKVTWDPRPPPDPEPWEGQPKLLTVTVLEGSNLRSVNGPGIAARPNDPFVVITAPDSDVSHRTPIIESGGAAPDWTDHDATFAFDYVVMPASLSVRCMNMGERRPPPYQDEPPADPVMIGFGTHSFDGQDRNSEWTQDVWVALADTNGDFGGKVRIRCSWRLNSPEEREISLFSAGLKTATLAGKLRKRAVAKASKKQRLRVWILAYTNLPPEAFVEFKIVTQTETIKNRWELDWDGMSYGPQCLNFLYTGDIPSKVFVRAMLPMPESAEAGMIGKITVGLDGLTPSELWHSEQKVVLYDSTGRRSNIGLHTKFEWDPHPKARTNLQFAATVYSVTGLLLPGALHLSPYVKLGTNSKGAYDPALNAQERSTKVVLGTGRAGGAAGWHGGRGEDFVFEMKHYPTEIIITVLNHDPAATDDIIGQAVLKEEIENKDRTKGIEYHGSLTLIALNHLGRPQKGKKAEVGQVQLSVRMWDPSVHETPEPPRLRIFRITVLGCTNLATRDSTRSNNPFVRVYSAEIF